MKIFKSEKLNTTMYVGFPHEIAPIYKAFTRRWRKIKRKKEICLDEWSFWNAYYDETDIDINNVTALIINDKIKDFFVPIGKLQFKIIEMLVQEDLQITGERKLKIENIPLIIRQLEGNGYTIDSILIKNGLENNATRNEVFSKFVKDKKCVKCTINYLPIVHLFEIALYFN